MWQTVPSAPFDHDLELAVIDDDGTHSLVFPCRRIVGGVGEGAHARAARYQPDPLAGLAQRDLAEQAPLSSERALPGELGFFLGQQTR
jgi:hypothetical protein